MRQDIMKELREAGEEINKSTEAREFGNIGINKDRKMGGRTMSTISREDNEKGKMRPFVKENSNLMSF
jgi:arginine repressor